MSEKEKIKNSHIDYSKSHENEYLIQKDLKQLYRDEFGEALANYNAKQKRNDRKMDDYYKHIQSSKKTALQQEMIVQVGDKDDFSGNPENIKLANEVLKEWFDEFQERNPNLKVYNAVIHNDEASPHMHLNFVPVASGYKRGLEKQVAFDRAILQQDDTLDKERPFDDWRKKEVQLLERMLKERGVERKLVGKNEYRDVNEFKEKKRELALIDKQISEKENELQSLEKNIEQKQKMSEMIPANLDIKTKKEFKIEVVKTGLFSKEEKKVETGNVVISREDYKKMRQTSNAALQVKDDYERLLKTDMVQENQLWRDEYAKLYKKMGSLERENRYLVVENNNLKKENTSLKARISDLRGEIREVYETTKNFLKARTDDLQAFQGVFKDWVDKVKEKVVGSEIERLEKMEEMEKVKKRSRNWDMER